MENTWKKEFKYDEGMLYRIRQLLGMVDFNKVNSVADLGCGNQHARLVINEIKPSVQYFGVDVLKHESDTIIRDFNKKEFFHQPVDLVLLSGVLEYIYKRNLKTFIKNICKNAQMVVGSYSFAETCPIRAPIWVNNLSFIQLASLFYQNGFVLAKYEANRLLPPPTTPPQENITKEKQTENENTGYHFLFIKNIKPKINLRKEKSKLYKFLHFYWLRGKE